MMKEKFINTNELANKTSEIIRDLNEGTNYVVLRYSDPVGVLISYEDYKKLQNLESEFVSECKACLGASKPIIQPASTDSGRNTKNKKGKK